LFEWTEVLSAEWSEGDLEFEATRGLRLRLLECPSGQACGAETQK
jgi:hypothetical protein